MPIIVPNIGTGANITSTGINDRFGITVPQINTNETNISTNASNITTKANQTDLNTEESARISADFSLQTQINDNNSDISGLTTRMTNTENATTTNSTNFTNHVAGNDNRHSAEDIDFSSTRPTITADDTKEAIEQVDARVDNIVNNPDPNKDIELVDARLSSEYGQFNSLKERADNTDVKLQETIDKIDTPETTGDLTNIASIFDAGSGTEGNYVVEDGPLLEEEYEGNDLKQLLPNDNFSKWITYGSVTDEGNGYKKINNQGVAEVGFRYKPNTEYTIISNILKNDLSNPFTILNGSDVEGNSIYIPSLTLGFRKDVFTTGTNFSDIYTMSGNGGTGDITIKTAIFEGNLTSYSDADLLTLLNIDGIVGTGDKKIIAENSNIFTTDLPKTLASDEILTLTDDGFTIEGSNWIVFSAKVEKNTVYTLKCIRDGNISIYDEDITSAIAVLGTIEEYSFNSGDNTRIQIVCYSLGTKRYFNKLQLNKGNGVLDYIDYDSNSKYITPLHGVPSAKDTIDFNNKKKIIRTYAGINDDYYVLNGSENWLLSGAPNQINTIAFYISISQFKGLDDVVSIISDLFVGVTHTSQNTEDIESIALGDDNSIRIRILRSRLTTEDVAGFKIWLASNNIKSNLKLANPVEYKLPQSNLTAYKDGRFLIENKFEYIEQSYSTSGIDMSGKGYSDISVSQAWLFDIDTGLYQILDVFDFTVIGTTITNGSLSVGDVLWLEIEYEDGRTLPIIKFDYAMNINSSVKSLNTKVNQNSEQIDRNTNIINVLNMQVDNFSNPNIFDNSDFQIWQNSEEFIQPIGGNLGADRWRIFHGADNNYRVFKTSKVVDGYDSALRMEAYSATGSTNSFTLIHQQVENPEKFSGKKLTFTVELLMDVGTIAYLQYSHNSADYTIGKTITGEGKVVKLSEIVDFSDKTVTTGIFNIVFTRTGVTVGNGITIQSAKLEFGEISTPHESKKYSDELRACQRHRIKLGGQAYSRFMHVLWESTTTAYGLIELPVEMRQIPNLSSNGTFATSIGTSGTIILDANQCTNQRMVVGWLNGSGGTSGAVSLFASNNDTDAYILFDASL